MIQTQSQQRITEITLFHLDLLCITLRPKRCPSFSRSRSQTWTSNSWHNILTYRMKKKNSSVCNYFSKNFRGNRKESYCAITLIFFLLRNYNAHHKTRSTTQVDKISQTQLILRPSKLWQKQTELFILQITLKQKSPRLSRLTNFCWLHLTKCYSLEFI